MSSSEMPPEAQHRAFVEKLQQFRGQLPAAEQPLLDTLVVAACGREEADVQGYWFNAPFDGMTLAQVWWPYAGSATYSGETAQPYRPPGY